MDVRQAVGSGTGTLAICLDCYQYIAREGKVLLLYISVTIEQEVWCVSATSKAVFDEALGSTALFGFAGDDAVLGVAGVSNLFINVLYA